MKNQTRNLLRVLVLLSLAHPAVVRAAYEDVGVSARATGFGNAFTAVADDAYAIHYNPAGLGLLYRPELATSSTPQTAVWVQRPYNALPLPKSAA